MTYHVDRVEENEPLSASIGMYDISVTLKKQSRH